MFLNKFPGAKEAHEIYPLFNDNSKKNFACRVCGCTWERKPSHGKCAGVKIYDEWSDVPKGLYSETALYRDHKRKLPDGTLPLAAKRFEMSSFTPLYSLEQADPDYKGKRAKSKAKVTPKAEGKKKEEIAETPASKKPSPFAWLDEIKKADL
jgi:hypothetical protein